jgi:hypothetical protein
MDKTNLVDELTELVTTAIKHGRGTARYADMHKLEVRLRNRVLNLAESVEFLTKRLDECADESFMTIGY